MKEFVIDTSALMKLFFNEPLTDEVVKIVAEAEQLHAPTLIWAEAANVVWKRVRRGDFSETAGKAILEDMKALQLILHNDSELAADAFRLGVETGRTAYDCFYLALAVREGCAVLTADERFVNGLRGGKYARLVRFAGTA